MENKLIPQKTIMDGNDEITVTGKGLYGENKRYLLEIEIVGVYTQKCLNVIMLNPSEYDKDTNRDNIFVDRTITNVIKIANDNKYNKINILNLFSEIQSKSTKANFKNIDEENLNFIIQYINRNNSGILLAWGCKFKKNTQKFPKLFNNLKQKKLMALSKTLDYPKHPGRMSIEFCRKKYGDGKKVKLKPYSLN